MENRVDALRCNLSGKITLLPTEYSDDDFLVCHMGKEQIRISDQSADQFKDLLLALSKKGIEPEGCYNCRYFHQPGATDDIDQSIGYCLDGKTGRHVNPLIDLTSKERSCDKFSGNEGNQREIVVKNWIQSIKMDDPKGV